MPNQIVAQESSAEHAGLSVHIAIADFMTALHDAKTPDDAFAIHRIVAEATVSLQAVESAALDRADALCGVGR